MTNQLEWNSRLVGAISNTTDDTAALERLLELLKPKPKPEVRHIGFLKVHKAASSTVQNILYRFGLHRNLSFVLPKPGHYLAKKKYSYNPVFPPLRKDNGKYDILCNHVRFNLAKFKELLHTDAVYIAIVRDPLELFISASYYYKFVWNFDYLKDMNPDTFIHDLIVNPKKWEDKNIQHSYTFNSLANDFGYEFGSIEHVAHTSDEQIEDFVQHIGCVFQYVMVMERFEESLVLLKRLLNWQLRDILFLDLNKYNSNGEAPSKVNVTDEEKRIFRERNRIDYKIYAHFYRAFEEKIAQEYRISEEVDHFHSVLVVMHAFCASERKENETLQVNSSEWNTDFVISMNDCSLMETAELDMFQQMISHHKELLSSEN